MTKIGITGSLSSGKTTASKILSSKKGPLFSADKIVKKLYQKNFFRKTIIKEFAIKDKYNTKIKTIIKNKILKNKDYLKKIEEIIHPLVRKEMRAFINKNKKKKLIFFEIPLLIESKLMKYFDIIIFIKAKKSIRLKRFISKGGNQRLFRLLDRKQLTASKKIKFCDHIIVNEKNIVVLKKKLLDILNKYE